jgi:hypothetical protein
VIPFLIAAISAQLSTPLNLNGQPIYRASCDGGIVCTKTGQTLTIIGTGSGSGGTSGAPVDGGFVVWTSVGSTNERVITAGTNVTLDTTTPGLITINATGGSSDYDGGYLVVQDEGGSLTKRTTIDFTGAGVTCTDTGSKTSCDIPSGGSGGASPLSLILGTP